MRLELTQAALADLRSIRRYTLKRWGKAQEQHYIDLIWRKFSDLQATRDRCRFRNDLFPNCQVAAVEKHVVLFRVQADTLQVVRVLHGAMDFSRHF